MTLSVAGKRKTPPLSEKHRKGKSPWSKKYWRVRERLFETQGRETAERGKKADLASSNVIGKAHCKEVSQGVSLERRLISLNPREEGRSLSVVYCGRTTALKGARKQNKRTRDREGSFTLLLREYVTTGAKGKRGPEHSCGDDEGKGPYIILPRGRIDGRVPPKDRRSEKACSRSISHSISGGGVGLNRGNNLRIGNITGKGGGSPLRTTSSEP